MVGMRIELGSARQVSDLSERAGFPLTHSGGQPFPEAGYSTEESSTRLLGQLADVASLVDEADRTIAYWMMNGLRSPSLPIDHGALRYELTGFSGAGPRDELPKSLGHVHARPHGSIHGYPEIIEVLHGRIAFMVFDLQHHAAGAAGDRAWIVVGDPGDLIVLPPDYHHLTIVADRGPALFADVIDLGAVGDYEGLRAAGGGPYLVRPSGAIDANPRWFRHPRLDVLAASEWNGGHVLDRPLGRALAEEPDQLAWLSDPDRFRERFPALAERIALA